MKTSRNAKGLLRDIKEDFGKRGHGKVGVGVKGLSALQELDRRGFLLLNKLVKHRPGTHLWPYTATVTLLPAANHN